MNNINNLYAHLERNIERFIAESEDPDFARQFILDNEDLLYARINEISLEFAAKAAGRVKGRARHSASAAKRTRQKAEIQRHPEGARSKDVMGTSTGTKEQGDPADFHSGGRQVGGVRSPEESDAEAHYDKKSDQARRVMKKLQARAAAEGGGKGDEGEGIEGREGKKAGKRFEKVSGKTEKATRRKAGSGAGRLRSAFGQTSSRKYKKTDTAHKEHFADPKATAKAKAKRRQERDEEDFPSN